MLMRVSHVWRQFAMRWRTEREVVVGKGQFVCAELSCREKDGLVSWEVPFAYREKGEHKTALVKVRLCDACSEKLQYKKKLKGHHKKGTASDPVNEILDEAHTIERE